MEAYSGVKRILLRSEGYRVSISSLIIPKRSERPSPGKPPQVAKLVFVHVAGEVCGDKLAASLYKSFEAGGGLGLQEVEHGGNEEIVVGKVGVGGEDVHFHSQLQEFFPDCHAGFFIGFGLLAQGFCILDGPAVVPVKE